MTLIFIMMVAGGRGIAYGEEETENEYSSWYDASKQKYVFPVTPSSKEWKDFDSHQQMIDACTIPEGLIEKLSTEELYQLVMEYPLISDVFFYDDAVAGFNQMRKYFNGLESFMGRNDALEVLLGEYNKLQITSDNEENKYDNFVIIHFMELILSDKDMIDRMSDIQKDRLSKAVYEKYCQKKEDDFYKGFEENAYEYAKSNETTLVINKQKGCELNNPKGSVSIQLFDDAEVFQLKSVGTAYVRTPRGSLVEVSIREEHNKDTIEKLNQSAKQNYPKATLVYPASNKYNCHSYVWHSPSPVNPYWINGGQAEIYVTDGSYRAIASYPTGVGRRVVWYDYDREGNINFLHSGILRAFKSPYDKEGIMVESKWTDGPVMLAEINYTPYKYENCWYRYYIRAD